MHAHVSLKRLIPCFFVIACLLSACNTNTAQTTTPPIKTNTGKIVKRTITHSAAHSSGCGIQPAQLYGSSINATLLSAGLKRTYRLHIPLDYNKENAQPLVINFHGHGNTDIFQERSTGMSTLADHQDFVVAYPQGTVGPDHRTGWNTGPKNYPHVNDMLFTNNLITHLETTLCINPDQIYAIGFSNGGGMTNVLACKLSERIAAFAIVSGAAHPVEGGCNPTRPVSILDFHGTHDGIVPYTGNPANDHEPSISQWLGDWAKRDSCTSGPVLFTQEPGVTGEKWTSCKGGATIIHYRIRGGIHVWPSLTTDKGIINATPIIWSFLKNYSLKTTSQL